MNIYETDKGMYVFKHLPAFAQFILDHHLAEFVEDQVDLSFRIDVPLLKHLKHFSREQLVAQSMITTKEFLSCISANAIKQYIEESMKRWLSNQLEIVGKMQVQVQDITLINYVRQVCLRKWIQVYTSDMSLAFSLIEEVDRYILGNNTTATNTYIQILKSHIEEETHFSKNVINASPAITYIFDLVQQKGVFVTGKVLEVMGYTPEEVLACEGNIITDLGHPEDVERMQGGLQQMFEENSNRTFLAEFRMKNKEGEYRWLRTYLVVFKRDEGGKPTEVLGQLYEITKEKQLIEDIGKREAQLLEAQRIARMGSFDWDFENKTTDYTPELRMIFELKDPQELKNLIEHIHTDDRERVRERMAAAMLTGFYECEYRYQVAGREKVLWAKGLVSFEDGKPKRMVGTVQDVTERKQIEESLIEKTMQLEKSNASLQEFASVASHDLKEPLRKIITFSDLVYSTEAGNLSADGKIYLEKIIDSAGRMRVLIEDILSYSSLSSKEQKEKADLNQIVKDVLATLEMQIKEKAAEVSVTKLPEATVYPLQMHQLFQNLFSNALKFSQNGTPLKITITHSHKKPAQLNGMALQKANEYLQIRIADNGIGFDKSSAEKIFGLFNRLHSKNQFEGTGLGLAICRRVADNHGGVIYADSVPGKGSVFTVLIPVA